MFVCVSVCECVLVCVCVCVCAHAPVARGGWATKTQRDAREGSRPWSAGDVSHRLQLQLSKDLLHGTCCQLCWNSRPEGLEKEPSNSVRSVWLGSYSALSRPCAPIWHRYRYAVVHVSQNPSPQPHSVSVLHSRILPMQSSLNKRQLSTTTTDPWTEGREGEGGLTQIRAVY